jgi:hypothetical protein
VKESRQKFRSRSAVDDGKILPEEIPDDVECEEAFSHQDKKISYLGEYCGIDTIRQIRERMKAGRRIDPPAFILHSEC